MVRVLGGGLAGSECAWQLAQRGHRVLLLEMRPESRTPAHQTDGLAELVCSNSLRGRDITVAVGVLKRELQLLDSLVMTAALASEIPGGGALVVDRKQFSDHVTGALSEHPLITVIRQEATEVGGGTVVVASGPLTSDALASDLERFLGREHLHFFDAASPIVDACSLDLSYMYWGSRYGKGEAKSYLNIPLGAQAYETFVAELAGAALHPRREFEPERLFEGCLPVEAMARRGVDTLRFGPMKPVGLPDPTTGEPPYALVQLRPENREATLFGMVGFQTNLTRPEQRRVFQSLPGMSRAVFERYGLMHRNTYIQSPSLLHATLEVRERPGVFFAGQLTGAEGYVEAAATGLVAGINAARRLQGLDPVAFPPETITGSLCGYLQQANPDGFQPMNASFGLVPPLTQKVGGRRARRLAMGQRALEVMAAFRRSTL